MDFSNVEDICTGGIVALMILKKKAVKNDCKIVVTGLTESIRANFELHKLNIMLGI